MYPLILLCIVAFAGSVYAKPASMDGCARPTGNTGNGLYAACGRINNPDGSEFRVMGVNRAHFEQGASAGIKLIGANAVRTFYSYYWGNVAQFRSDFESQIDAKLVPIATASDLKDVGGTSCNKDPVRLSRVVDAWIADKAVWTLLNKGGMVNVANEWGPDNSVVWRDAYVKAIQKLRAAGFSMPLVIDAGGCGQDTKDILAYGAALAAADPQHNVVLAFHLYGGTPDDATMNGYYQQFASLAKATTGMAVLVGEFGPGKNIGPSPTLITPSQVIAGAGRVGLGWIAWAWDDNNLGACKSDDTWFSMTTDCAQYSGQPSQLTAFGHEVLDQLKTLAPAPAKLF